MASHWDSKQNGGEEPEQLRKIFVGGLTPSTTGDTLKEFYGKFGDVVESIVVNDKMTGKPRGFGFVTYSKKTDVDEAMKNRPHEIDGKVVDSKRALPRDPNGTPNIPTQRLYVSGIREEHTEDAFREYFGTFGNVTKVDIVLDKQTGKPRGFAFVTFDDHDPVDHCVLLKSHTIAGFRCDVKKALSKEEQARAQQMSYDRQMRGNRAGGFGAPYGGGAPGGGWQGGSFRDRGSYGAPAWGAQAQPQWQGGGGYPQAGGYQGSWGAQGAGQWGAGGGYGAATGAAAATPYAQPSQWGAGATGGGSTWQQ